MAYNFTGIYDKATQSETSAAALVNGLTKDSTQADFIKAQKAMSDSQMFMTAITTIMKGDEELKKKILESFK